MSLRQIPQHVAIIMDGNGRWAQKRGRPRFFGHVRGSTRVREIVREAHHQGVKALTLFAFSTENWMRPRGELDVLWGLLKKFIAREIDELHRRNVRLSVIGEVDRLADDIRQGLEQSIQKLSGNTGMHLTLAISYGARREITRAATRFAQDCVSGACKPGDLTETDFEKYLWTSGLGPLSEVDLLIRTSGEKRVSNFLLWQAAYAEFVFMDICWPDFDSDCFKAALDEYGARDRRFGGVVAQPSAVSSVSQVAP